jgi:hypothetical protein
MMSRSYFFNIHVYLAHCDIITSLGGGDDSR